MKQIFGIPYHIESINGYNKQEIINDITFNYNKDKGRNKWDEFSNLHHANKDSFNKEFKEINFQPLIPLYEKAISNFLMTLKSNKDFSFKFDIVNYTCVTRDQFMKMHDHIKLSDFHAVHYVKFNPSVHKSTLYKNTHIFGDYLKHLRKGFYESMDEKQIENSWLQSDYYLDVKEDDMLILPSCIPHMIPAVKTDETRITIVLNIKVNDTD
jgi:hypothetical protein